jgi:hypothetical protein
MWIKYLQDEKGSASTEFVVFLIPLFIPLILLASHLFEISHSKIESGALARTAIRAFVTAESTQLGHARIRQVLENSQNYQYEVECENIPCIQPMNRIRLTLHDLESGVKVATALGVDKWIVAEKEYFFKRELLNGN